MNIKEHIEAGHYPKDDKGRALVPYDGPGGSCSLITIYATDHSTSFPICGRHPDCSDAETYSACGVNLGGNGDLLPPPPRKVVVKRYGVVRKSDGQFQTTNELPDAAGLYAPALFHIFPMTGEYEVPHA